ncbi:MAG: PAS domain S-box protein [Deltaproteobacteria bacterium]|nr:PAS domain S-box protein [Deltaproteobacteria bacterium]
MLITSFLWILILLLTIFVIVLAQALKKKKLSLHEERRRHRKTMEAVLAREKETRLIFDSMNDFLFFYDMDGNFLEVNAATEKALGRRIFSKDRLNLKDIVPAPHDKQTADFLKRIRAKGQERGYMRVKTGEGRHLILEHHSVLVCDDSGTPRGVRGLARDVTENFYTKRALKRSEKRYRAILESIEEGYYECDLAGNLTFFNPALAGMLGYPEKELKGMNYRAFVEDSYAEAVFEAFNSVFRTGRAVKSFDWRLRRKDGSFCHVEASVALIGGEEAEETGKKTPTGFRGIIRDITGRVEAAKRQKSLEAQLVVAQRMESIGVLAGGIAHDFNNILFPMIGYTEMAVSDLPEESLIRENLESVLKSAYRARDLVRQILAFSREHADQVTEPVFVQPVIREIAGLLRKTVSTAIDIKSEIDDSVEAVMILPTRLHQVVMNLCTNSVQAMENDETGTLYVTLDKKDLRKTDIAVGTGLVAGPHVVITISDTGPGIKEEIAGKIFEPYFTTKPKDKGSGLGLAIVWGIVKKAGGMVFAKNQPNGGALFEIYLPVAVTRKAPADKTGDFSPGPDALPTGSETILLVDDEQEIVLLEKSILENLGYTVVPRTSSVEALEAFKFDPARFDLVITDHSMPNMTGLMLSRVIFEIRPDIPILICTGFSEQVTEDKVAAMGIRQMLMKPISSRELAYAVRKAVDGGK